MTVLVDTGLIVAILDRRELHHSDCLAFVENSHDVLVACDAVIAEACHILRRLNGAARDLLTDIEVGRYMTEYRLRERTSHLQRLLAKYADVPMTLADACLVDLAKIHNTGRILTLDSDFRVYRWGRNQPFELLIDF